MLMRCIAIRNKELETLEAHHGMMRALAQYSTANQRCCRGWHSRSDVPELCNATRKTKPGQSKRKVVQTETEYEAAGMESPRKDHTQPTIALIVDELLQMGCKRKGAQHIMNKAKA
eukprot:1146389-Pelagomonas_calceolata.AAC.4